MTSPHRTPVSLYTLSQSGQLRPHTSIPSPYNLMNTRTSRNSLFGSSSSNPIELDSSPIPVHEDKRNSSPDEDSRLNIERLNDGEFDFDITPPAPRDVLVKDVRRAELVVYQASNKVKEIRYAHKLGLFDADVKEYHEKISKAEQEHSLAIKLLDRWHSIAQDQGVIVDAIHPNTIAPSRHHHQLPSASASASASTHKRHFKDIVTLPPSSGMYSSNPDQFTPDEVANNRAHATHWKFGNDDDDSSSAAIASSTREFIDNAVSSSQSQRKDDTMDVYSQDPQGLDTVDQHRAYRDWTIAKQREKYANIAKPIVSPVESLSASQLLEQLE